MRILVTTAQVPFIRGGAELMTETLVDALIRHGHEVEVVSTPFTFHSRTALTRSIDYWRELDLAHVDAGPVDQVICLKFPTYHVRHPNKVVWLMHQHRSVYELFDTPLGERSNNSHAMELRNFIVSTDTISLSEVNRVYTISKNVSRRLDRYNGVKSKPLYQPPRLAAKLRHESTLPYIFYPSRVETLKRQKLLIESAVHLKGRCQIFIAGTGGQLIECKALVEKLELGGTVKFLGRINEQQLIDYYANCLAVFFGPIDEDYGFVTLEAMLSEKPVITCTDSGGTLEFVVPNETGLVVDPTPDAVGDAIARFAGDAGCAIEMGKNGKLHYESLGISWDYVVTELVR